MTSQHTPQTDSFTCPLCSKAEMRTPWIGGSLQLVAFSSQSGQSVSQLAHLSNNGVLLGWPSAF